MRFLYINCSMPQHGNFTKLNSSFIVLLRLLHLNECQSWGTFFLLLMKVAWLNYIFITNKEKKLVWYIHHHHHPVLIRFYPRKRGWPDLPHSASNLFHSHSPFRSIPCILLLQTNTLTLLHLWSPCLPRSLSTLSLINMDVSK